MANARGNDKFFYPQKYGCVSIARHYEAVPVNAGVKCRTRSAFAALRCDRSALASAAAVCWRDESLERDRSVKESWKYDDQSASSLFSCWQPLQLALKQLQLSPRPPIHPAHGLRRPGVVVHRQTLTHPPQRRRRTLPQSPGQNHLRGCSLRQLGPGPLRLSPNAHRTS
jgi:hypothetical protein